MKTSEPAAIECRAFCGACCIAPSISSSIPGMPDGKAAGIPCIHLDENMRCKIFNSPDRPKVCASLAPCREMCGSCREEAMEYLENLERLTSPEHLHLSRDQDGKSRSVPC